MTVDRKRFRSTLDLAVLQPHCRDMGTHLTNQKISTHLLTIANRRASVIEGVADAYRGAAYLVSKISEPVGTMSLDELRCRDFDALVVATILEVTRDYLADQAAVARKVARVSLAMSLVTVLVVIAVALM